MLIGPSGQDPKPPRAGSSICFSCGQRIDDAYKVWYRGSAEDAGEHVNLVLHTLCAGLLALQLASDAVSGDLKNGQRVLNYNAP